MPFGAHYLALSLAISQRANFVAYICNIKKNSPLPSPPPLWEGVVTTAICENPVASMLSVFNSPSPVHRSPLIRSPLTSNPLTCDIVAINRGIATLTFNLLFHYGNIQQQQHLGQDPQHRNHRTYGNCNYVWYGELHVVNSRPLPSPPLYGRE